MIIRLDKGWRAIYIALNHGFATRGQTLSTQSLLLCICFQFTRVTIAVCRQNPYGDVFKPHSIQLLGSAL